jgi:hypothetical protein
MDRMDLQQNQRGQRDVQDEGVEGEVSTLGEPLRPSQYQSQSQAGEKQDYVAHGSTSDRNQFFGVVGILFDISAAVAAECADGAMLTPLERSRCELLHMPGSRDRDQGLPRVIICLDTRLIAAIISNPTG